MAAHDVFNASHHESTKHVSYNLTGSYDQRPGGMAATLVIRILKFVSEISDKKERKNGTK